ncbi:MAG TPA: HupE/UreJ family protein [Verrucomicrobiae bacterium]|jgi:hydrogenase/urease accessory protein HupE
MLIRRFIATLAFLSAAISSFAHDPGLSSAKLVLEYGALHATLTFAPADIDSICNGEKPSLAQLNQVAAQSLEIWFDGKKQLATESKARVLDNKDVEFALSFPAPAASKLRINSALLDRLAFGHRQYFSLTSAYGSTLSEKLLSATSHDIEVPLSAAASAQTPPPSHPFTQFLGMGVRHILTGYDHLLFLFALLIGCRRFSSVIKVITAFTVAHSISLALATLGWVEIPGRIVEPLIAASIVYVGVENLVRRQNVSHRALLTFGFGLVHGFGFAGALREMGVGVNGGAVAIPLLAFNSGVEIGQMMVASVILPILWHFKDKPQFAIRWAPVCSAIVVLAGGFWFVQRVFFS